MITIFICDDNSEALLAYSKTILQIAKKHNLIIKIFEFMSGEELLFKMEDLKIVPDIIYLDIIMDSVNGIETANKLRELDCYAEIIFLTDSEDYVFESFDVNPTQYLLKNDTSNEKFERVFLQTVQLIRRKSTEKFLIESNTGLIAIPIKNILYFEIFKRKVTVHHVRDKTIDYYTTMKKIENQLIDKHFIRVHRSYVRL